MPLTVLPITSGTSAPPTLREARLKRMHLPHRLVFVTVLKCLPTQHLIVPMLRPAICLRSPICLVLVTDTALQTL